MGKAPKTLKIVIYPPLHEYNFFKDLFSLAYFLWALDILISSDSDSIYYGDKGKCQFMEPHGNSKDTGDWNSQETITALDFCQEYLSCCQEKDRSVLVFVSLHAFHGITYV